MYNLLLDTNILLLDHNNLLILGRREDVTIVLPETVLEELDSKKSGLNELAFQSRAISRLLAKATVVETVTSKLGTVTTLALEGIAIKVVSLLHYNIDTSSDSKNDQKILAVATSGILGGETIVMSNDAMVRFRGLAVGLKVTDFKVVDKVDYEFTRTLEVDDATFRALHGKSIIDIDPSHLIEHYNYKFTTPDSDHIKLATIDNETITILGKETEDRLRKQDVNPQGADQLLLTKVILDPSIDLVVCEALAGSGKTLVSLSSAIQLIKDKTTPYTSIIYVRSSINDVEAIEEVGFLPGTAEEKNAIYFHPLYDSLDYIARARFKDPKAGKVVGIDFEDKVAEHIEKMVKDYHITPMTGLGMRGRTFKDAIFIYDEVQNASKPSLQKALTRIGKNCKVILIGSNKQIDNPNMTKFTNGLSVILHDCATKTGDKINRHVVPLNRVVRSDFAEYAEKLFAKVD